MGFFSTGPLLKRISLYVSQLPRSYLRRGGVQHSSGKSTIDESRSSNSTRKTHAPTYINNVYIIHAYLISSMTTSFRPCLYLKSFMPITKELLPLALERLKRWLKFPPQAGKAQPGWRFGGCPPPNQL